MKLPFSKKKETGDDVLDKIEKLEQALQEKKPRFKPKLMGLQVFFKKKKPAEQKLEEESKVEEEQPKQEEKPRQEEKKKQGKKVSKTLFRISIIICGVISFFIIIMNIVNNKGLVNLLVFLLGFWLTCFIIILALLWGAYLFYLDMRIFNRTKAVEAVFPDFLQLTSANISAGMPIDRALWYAVRPGFGVLAKEIESVAKNNMAGEDQRSAVFNFANKYNSKIIQRSISLLLGGKAAGGELADPLKKEAMNIEETKLIKKEMASSVTTYVIFIIFATIIAAPVLFGLSTQLLVVIKAITGRLGSTMSSSSSIMGFSFSGDAIKTSDFSIFAYLMLGISAFSSACIVSIIRKGRVKEGLAQIPVFIIVALLIYTFASLLIGGMFSSMF